MTEWALLAQSYIIQLISCFVNFFRKPIGENLRFVIARIVRACTNIVTFSPDKNNTPR